jgi:hypothetical protein
LTGARSRAHDLSELIESDQEMTLPLAAQGKLRAVFLNARCQP